MSKICKKRVRGNDKKTLPWDFKKCPGSLHFTLLIFRPLFRACPLLGMSATGRLHCIFIFKNLPMFPLKKNSNNQLKLTISYDRFSSWNLLFEYYYKASQQIMSCEPTSSESISLRVGREQGCKLRANEPVSVQVKSLWGCALT